MIGSAGSSPITGLTMVGTPSRRPLAPLPRQRGVAMIFIVVGLAALLLTAALALDVGHATLNKTRLQNATDAAALAAAKTLDSTKSAVLATTEAITAFTNNANSSGDSELAAAYANGSGTVTITVTYSATLPPFTAGSPNGPYVRVAAAGFTRPTWLASLAGISNVTLSATAVAGPSPSLTTNACNLVPMMVCGSTSSGAANNWGFTDRAPYVLKEAAPGGGLAGSGDFQLIALGGNGANQVRKNLASGQGCMDGSTTVTTEPGNEAGPTAQGVDTRFGDYTGPLGGDESIYPPDVITTQPNPLLTVSTSGGCSQSAPCIKSGSTTLTAANVGTIFNYDKGSNNYLSELPNSANYTYQPIPTGPGVAYRRMVTLPITDCSSSGGGKKTLPLLGFGCFFLLQEVIQQGTIAYVLGEFIASSCDGNGVPGNAPNTGPGPYIIQLYRNPGSPDS